MNFFLTKVPNEMFWIFISINFHRFCDFCRLVKFPGTWTSDFNEQLITAMNFGDADRSGVRIVKARGREGQTLLNIERKREDTREKIGHVFRRMLSNAEVERFIHAAINVGEFNLKTVKSRRHAHGIRAYTFFIGEAMRCWYSLPMINNDVIRAVRFILNVSEFKLVEIVALGGGQVTQQKINAYMKEEEEPGFELCPQNLMARFLNGLIIFKRGKDESKPPMAPELPTNNVVLKKLRVAFQLKDEDILEMLDGVGFKISKSELSALFRKEGHVNYRACGDQLLRNFLKALANREKEKQ